jgi:hypothetical protein
VNTLPSRTKDQVSFNKMLTGLRAHQDGGAICEFSDGTTAGPFDLVVGCDGIKSAVKEYIERGKISEKASKREGGAAGIYSGIRIRYAIQDGDASEKVKEPAADLKQVFADGAFALGGTYGNGSDRPNSNSVFIISLDDDYIGPFKKKEAKAVSASAAENADWSQDIRKPLVDTRKGMLEQMKRFKIPDLEFCPIIENSDRFFELGGKANA